MKGITIRRFEQPGDTRTFSKGVFDVVELGGMTIGRASYDPGWKWSTDVGAQTGVDWCPVEHVGLVISGRAAVEMRNGPTVIMQPGDLFHIAPEHDSWVVGDEPYVSLHLCGAETYASSDDKRSQGDAATKT